MAKATITVTVSAEGDVKNYGILLDHKSVTIDTVNGVGKRVVEAPGTYQIVMSFIGNPGSSMTAVVTAPDGKQLCKISDTVAAGRSHGANHKSFVVTGE